MDDTALMAAFTRLLDADPDGLGEELIELTGNHHDLEADGWRISSDNQPAPVDTLPAPWDDDPDYPMEDWRYEGPGDDELRGYRDWVAHQRELVALDFAQARRLAPELSPNAGNVQHRTTSRSGPRGPTPNEEVGKQPTEDQEFSPP